MKIYIIEKSKKINSEKTVSQFSLKPFKKMAHDAIQWLKNSVQYLNVKRKGKMVEIIDLKLCSSLKWDGV